MNHPMVLRRVVTLVTRVTLILLCGFAAGCNGSGSQPDQDGSAQPDTPASAIVPLEEIISGLQPSELNSSVDPGMVVTLLNEWGDVMLQDMVAADVSDQEVADSLASSLDQDQISRVLQRRFVIRDASHIRDMCWARDFVNTFSFQDDSVLLRVSDLFYYVVDTVEVREADADAIPLAPFDTVLHGRGTPRDRAWVFGLLLKHMRIPAVVMSVEPATAEPVAENLDPPSADPPAADPPAVDPPAVDPPAAGSSEAEPAATDEAVAGTPVPSARDSGREHVLVGVCLDGQLYVFDMTVGLPIPGPDDRPEDILIRRPATLAQLRSEDSLLRKMDVDEAPYPYHSEQFQNVTLQVIGDTSLWSRRCEGLGNALTGDDYAVVYEKLCSTPGLPGIRETIVNELSGQITIDRVSVWPWPEQQREARGTLTERQREKLTVWEGALGVPYALSIVMRAAEPGGEKQPELEISPGRADHRLARTRQITGQVAESIPLYLRIQTWQMVPPLVNAPGPPDEATQTLIRQLLPEAERNYHLIAAEQAIVWRATCQLQQRHYEAASTDLDAYLRQVNQRGFLGLFAVDAQYLAGISSAMRGDKRRARAFLGLIPVGSSRRAAARLLLARWSDPLTES